MKKVVVALDSFKGTLPSEKACRIVSEAATKIAPMCEVVEVPIADGGEGTCDCFLKAIPGSVRVDLKASGPYGDVMDAFYVRHADTAIVELAVCAGLPLVDGCENPRETTTFGVGEMIAHAVDSGCRNIVLGLGGSCTNDAGCGMAAALGVVFKNKAGDRILPTGGTLALVEEYDLSEARRRLHGVTVSAMCDIDSPMHGPDGAAYVFAPQKGASPMDVDLLDVGLKRLSEVILRQSGVDVARISGAGAAGGAGAGVVAFFGGALKPGIETVLDAVGFDSMLDGADLVITGEGRVDAQSARGKAVSGIAMRAKRRGVPAVVLAGGVEPGAEMLHGVGVTAVFSITRRCRPIAEVLLDSTGNLRETAENLFRLWLAAERSGS